MSPPHSPQQRSRPHLCSTSRSATSSQSQHLHDTHPHSTSQLGLQPDLTFTLSDSFFDDAFAPGSPPTPPSFLDNILNPEPIDTRARRGPSWSNYNYRQRPRSPIFTTNSPFRTNAMSSRLPSGYVDLTSDPPSPPRQNPRRPSKRTAALRTSAEPAAGPSSKRIKRNDGLPVERTPATPQLEIEEIDLSDDKIPLQEALRKQRAEAVKAQEKPDEKPLRLSNLQCVICLEQPTDMTATSCGHLYCHTCLMESLIAGENRSAEGGETKKSTCPICRKFINRGKASDIIPLLMKKGLATQPRKKATPAVV